MELLKLRERFPDKRMSEIADLLDWSRLPRIDSSSTVSESSVNYVGELVQRAISGDKYAVSLLEHLRQTGSFNGAPTEPGDG
jgi:hypothetical protein